VLTLRPLPGEALPMKTVSRILLVLAIIGAIYFATVGRNEFFRVIDTIYDVIQAFAANYTRK